MNRAFFIKSACLTHTAGVALFALLAANATGQDANPICERMLRFAHTETPQRIAEIATAVQSISEIRHASVAAAERVLALKGTPTQVAMAEWVFDKLDQESARPGTLVTEFHAPAGADDVVRVFYLSHPQTVQAFQEIAAAVRSTAEIHRVFTYNALKAMVVRGPASQIEMAAWLIDQLDRPIASRSELSTIPVYRTWGKPDDVIEIYHVRYTPTVAAFQEVATSARSIAEIRRVFTYNDAGAIVARGTPSQLAMAKWLVGELDQPVDGREQAQLAATHEYRVPNAADDIVRVFYFPQTPTVQSFQEVAQLIRTQASIRRAFTYNAPRALALRGSADQMAQAERLSKELDRKP